MKKILLYILISIVSIWVVLAILPRPQSIDGDNPMRIEKNTRPLLIAHGGGNLEFPDNTLEAFYNAYSVDANVMMETDVSLTKDGVVILSHDTTLDRKTTLVNAPIIDVDYQELIDNEVCFGYHNQVVPNSNGFNVSGEFHVYKNHRGETVTPLDVTYPEGIVARHDSLFLATTLEELLIAFPNNKVNVEIKQQGEVGLLALAAVIELLDRLDEDYNTFNRIVLASFHRDIYLELETLQKTSHPQLLFSPESKGVTKFFILHVVRLDVFYNDSVAALQLPMSQYGINLATRGIVRTAHRHNIAVHYWTIDDPDDMLHLIKIGADGIMTNLPTVLKEVYDEYFGE